MMQGLNLSPQMLQYLMQMRQQQSMQQAPAMNSMGPQGAPPAGMPMNAQQPINTQMPPSYQALAALLAQSQGAGSSMGMMRGLNNPGYPNG
jgi:hypothetical protein